MDTLCTSVTVSRKTTKLVRRNGSFLSLTTALATMMKEYFGSFSNSLKIQGTLLRQLMSSASMKNESDYLCYSQLEKRAAYCETREEGSPVKPKSRGVVMLMVYGNLE